MNLINNIALYNFINFKMKIIVFFNLKFILKISDEEKTRV